MSSLEEDTDFLLLCCQGCAGLSVVARWRCSQWSCGLLLFPLPATKTYAPPHKHVPLQAQMDRPPCFTVAANLLTQGTNTNKPLNRTRLFHIWEQKWFLENPIRRQIFSIWHFKISTQYLLKVLEATGRPLPSVRVYCAARRRSDSAQHRKFSANNSALVRWASPLLTSRLQE